MLYNRCCVTSAIYQVVVNVKACLARNLDVLLGVMGLLAYL